MTSRTKLGQLTVVQYGVLLGLIMATTRHRRPVSKGEVLVEIRAADVPIDSRHVGRALLRLRMQGYSKGGVSPCYRGDSATWSVTTVGQQRAARPKEG